MICGRIPRFWRLYVETNSKKRFEDAVLSEHNARKARHDMISLLTHMDHSEETSNLHYCLQTSSLSKNAGKVVNTLLSEAEKAEKRKAEKRKRAESDMSPIAVGDESDENKAA